MNEGYISCLRTYILNAEWKIKIKVKLSISAETNSLFFTVSTQWCRTGQTYGTRAISKKFEKFGGKVEKFEIW